MSKNRIITITGGDCAGKETQTKLLAETLQPSKRLSAPDYSHWSGRIVSAILRERGFYIPHDMSGSDVADFIVYRQDKHPQILQLLHNINTWSKQDIIREGLKSHHWVMDRYIEDAYAFGLQDGCDLGFLLELNRRFIQSDVVIVMLGKGFPRPGEIQDINERDTSFQESVRSNYISLARLFPNWNVIDIDLYRHLDKAESIHAIHRTICGIISRTLALSPRPLSVEQVSEYIEQWEKSTKKT